MNNNKMSLFSTGLSDENRDVRLLYKRLAARDRNPSPTEILVKIRDLHWADIESAPTKFGVLR